MPGQATAPEAQQSGPGAWGRRWEMRRDISASGARGLAGAGAGGGSRGQPPATPPSPPHHELHPEPPLHPSSEMPRRIKKVGRLLGLGGRFWMECLHLCTHAGAGHRPGAGEAVQKWDTAAASDPSHLSGSLWGAPGPLWKEHSPCGWESHDQSLPQSLPCRHFMGARC